jgi:hypothetical protein
MKSPILKKLGNLLLALILLTPLLAALAGYFAYPYLNSPLANPVYVDSCQRPAEENYYSTRIATVLADKKYADWLISLSGRLAYYPESKKFLLRDGLDYITLDLSSCQNKDTYQDWPSFYAKVDGKLVIDKNEAKLVVRRFNSATPRELLSYALILGGLATVALSLVVVLLKIIIQIIRRFKGKK